MSVCLFVCVCVCVCLSVCLSEEIKFETPHLPEIVLTVKEACVCGWLGTIGGGVGVGGRACARAIVVSVSKCSLNTFLQ